MIKHRIFIGSSTEGENLLKAVCKKIEGLANIDFWRNIFNNGEYTFESLWNELQVTDFAILIGTPDDMIFIRENECLSIRDNVLFELGMFLGKLGRKKVFFLIPDQFKITAESRITGMSGSNHFHIPTDLAGITFLKFDFEKYKNKLYDEAVVEVCSEIKFIIEKEEFPVPVKWEKLYNFKEIQHLRERALEWNRDVSENHSYKIYSLMEALNLLSNFMYKKESREYFITNLKMFYRTDNHHNTIDNTRFNLIRHLRFLPQLCHTAKIYSSDPDEWEKRKNEALIMLIASQNENGSWGYFPKEFNEDRINKSYMQYYWNKMRSSRLTIRNKVIDMGNFYFSKNYSPSISENSIIWTAYSLMTYTDFEKYQVSDITKDALAFLIKHQNIEDGGWGFIAGDISRVSASCIALNAIMKCSCKIQYNTYGDNILRGLTYINNVKNKFDYDIESDENLENPFRFSITHSIIECFCSSVIHCQNILKENTELHRAILQYLSQKIDYLLTSLNESSNNPYIPWKDRIIVESLKHLWSLYNSKVNIEDLSHFSDIFEKIMLPAI